MKKKLWNLKIKFLLLPDKALIPRSDFSYNLRKQINGIYSSLRGVQRGSVVGWGTILQAVNLKIYRILPALLGPGIYSDSNRNEYQEQKKNVSGEYSTAVAWDWQLPAICEPIV
jgi:hypothetical protein